MRWPWRTRPRVGSCCATASASRSSRRATNCASSPGRFSPTARRVARRSQPRQLLERAIPQAELAEVGDRVPDIGKVAAGGAAAAADQRHRPGKWLLAGELAVLAIGEIDQRLDRAAIVEMDRPDRLGVDAVIVDLAM